MSLEELQGRLGYVFSDPRLLARALTHSSFANENAGVADNEQLEFLGDAVLELCVSDLLCREFPAAPEGQLSALRTRLVNTEALAEIARDLGLGPLLQLGRGEDATGGRRKASILECATEAVLGAVFRDGGHERAMKLTERWVLDRIHALDEDTVDLTWKDPKSKLQEVVQGMKVGGRPQPAPIYRVAREQGPDHQRVFTVDVLVGGRVIGHGEGKSKKIAEKNAAECALRDLGVKA